MLFKAQQVWQKKSLWCLNHNDRDFVHALEKAVDKQKGVIEVKCIRLVP